MTETRIVIIGSNGQLGTDLVRAFPESETLPLTHQDLEITDERAVQALFERVRPSAVINTAAYHHTAKCEEHPDSSFAVNAIGPLNLAKACARTDCLLVHVSTDYVFDGNKKTPYVEEDKVSPLNVYGLSKVAGELAVLKYCPRHYVVRSCGLYGLVPCRAKGDNFITKILSLAAERGEVTVVNDEIATPTWTFSLAKQIHRLCSANSVPYGIVHASDEGECSWYDFTAEIFRLSGTTAALKPSSVEEARPAIRRPRYSVLENRALKQADANVMRGWKESLAEYLRLAGRTR
jgi:dTDP-4-dehydrorhamnose reductase